MTTKLRGLLTTKYNNGWYIMGLVVKHLVVRITNVKTTTYFTAVATTLTIPPVVPRTTRRRPVSALCKTQTTRP